MNKISKILTTEQEAYIHQVISSAAFRFWPETFDLSPKGNRLFKDTEGLASKPQLVELARMRNKSSGNVSNDMQGLFTEMLGYSFLGLSTLMFIRQFETGLGDGDRGIDGFIHDVPFDIKSFRTTPSCRVSKERPWEERAFIFINVDKALPVTQYTIEGYAWRTEALPHCDKDFEKGWRICPVTLAEKGLLETNILKLREGSFQIPEPKESA